MVNESGEKTWMVVGHIGLALCYFDLWDLDQCLQNLQMAIVQARVFLKKNFMEFHLKAFQAIVNIEQGQTDNISSLLADAQKQYKQYKNQEDAWGQTYFLLFSGRARLKLGEIDIALQLLEEAVLFTSGTSFPQGQGKSQSLLGELYRNRDNDRSLEYQQTAIQTLDKISAICDLAEAYFFQALTYRDMGNSVKAQESLDRAQELYRSFDAPLQIDRTNKVFYQP